MSSRQNLVVSLLSLVFLLSFAQTSQARQQLMCPSGSQEFQKEISKKDIRNCKKKRKECRNTLFKGKKKLADRVGISCNQDVTRGNKNICTDYRAKEKSLALKGAGCLVGTMKIAMGAVLQPDKLVVGVVKKIADFVWNNLKTGNIGRCSLQTEECKKESEKANKAFRDIFNLSVWSEGAQKIANKYRFSCYTPEISEQVMCAQMTILTLRYSPQVFAIAAKIIASGGLDLTAVEDIRQLLEKMALSVAKQANPGFKDAYGSYQRFSGIANTMELALEQKLETIDDMGELSEVLQNMFLDPESILKEEIRNAAQDYLKDKR